MRWATRLKVLKEIEAAGWHRWFAWHPVVVNDEWHWLVVIERRLVVIGWGCGLYNYRECR